MKAGLLNLEKGSILPHSAWG